MARLKNKMDGAMEGHWWLNKGHNIAIEGPMDGALEVSMIAQWMAQLVAQWFMYGVMDGSKG